MFRVIICGSRNFNNYELLSSACDYYLSERLKTGEVIIVSGCANGADKLGERYASERGLSVERFPADWERYGKSAGYKRNSQMAEVGNACIAFLSTTSENKGTKMMVSIARNNRLLVRSVNDQGCEVVL